MSRRFVIIRARLQIYRYKDLLIEVINPLKVFENIDLKSIIAKLNN